MKLLFLSSILLLSIHTFSQRLPKEKKDAHADTLRGSITKERAWWDLKHYNLNISVNPKRKKIKGQNTITYSVLEPYDKMQIDLQDPLKIKSITQNGSKLKFEKDGYAYYIQLIEPQIVGNKNKIIIEYFGKPRQAKHAPWDGGFSWEKDLNNKDFIATSCQGLGASAWWPCKDHMYDEPDNGMAITSTVPKGLTAVSNGRLINQVNKGKTNSFTWQVLNPINNYGVNLNIGDYVSFSEKYNGENGILDMDYWVLESNINLAKAQFKDAKKTIEAFEHWFGPYPFYEDSYKLVEVPYLGMEHQSSVTYGNGFKNGYLGRDLSGTGWGLKFDFIIVHESGHEWFANNITNKDIADMWIHESFTSYSEALFLEYHYGKKAGEQYIQGIRKNIANKEAMISQYDINQSPTSDIYYKGSNMLHTLRQFADNDILWREMLRGLNKDFYHQTVTTKQVENYIANALGLNLDEFFNQYLRNASIPTLEYSIKGNLLLYKWTNCNPSFNMPIKGIINGEEKTLSFMKNQILNSLIVKSGTKDIVLDPNYYVKSIKLDEK
jgi:aminopeptidase N